MNIKKEGGFTLIELVVSMAVLGVTIIALYGFFVSVRDVNRYTRNTVIAQQAAQQQMENYRNTPYESIPTGTQDISSILSSYSVLGSARSATAVITENNTGIKQIDVTVSYQDRGGQKNVQFTTLIAAKGIGQ